MTIRGKKGDQNWMIITLVIAVIALVVVALAMTGAFDKITDAFSKVTSLETAAQACGLYASQDLKTSYCNNFQKVEINGKKQYVNCDYLADNSLAVFDSRAMDCGDISTAAKELCVNKRLKDDDLVNGASCVSYGTANQR